MLLHRKKRYATSRLRTGMSHTFFTVWDLEQPCLLIRCLAQLQKETRKGKKRIKICLFFLCHNCFYDDFSCTSLTLTLFLGQATQQAIKLQKIGRRKEKGDKTRQTDKDNKKDKDIHTGDHKKTIFTCIQENKLYKKETNGIHELLRFKNFEKIHQDIAKISGPLWALQQPKKSVCLRINTAFSVECSAVISWVFPATKYSLSWPHLQG